MNPETPVTAQGRAANFLPMTFNWPDWVAEFPPRFTAVHAYVPASFRTTLLMTRVPLAKTACLLSMGSERPSTEKEKKYANSNALLHADIHQLPPLRSST